GEDGRAPDADVPVARERWDFLEVAVTAEDGRGRLRAPAREPRETVGAVADEGEVVGHRLRLDAELRAHAIDVEELFLPPVELKDVAAHALAHVFIGRTDQDAVDRRIGRGKGCGA